MKDENDKQIILSWMDTDISTTVTNTKNNQNRKRRFLPLLLGIGAVASAILSAGTAIYTSEQLMQIKRQMTKSDTYLASHTDTITEKHDQLVRITKATDSLYEYTHKTFRKLTEELTQLQCNEHQEFEFLTRLGNMKAWLYADFESAITAAYSGHPTPILLPPSDIRELMKNNAYLFNNTIYQTDLNFVYQYGYAHPVLPIRYGKIGYVLGLPRILAPNQTPLYCIKSNAIVHGNKMSVQVNAPALRCR